MRAVCGGFSTRPAFNAFASANGKISQQRTGARKESPQNRTLFDAARKPIFCDHRYENTGAAGGRNRDVIVKRLGVVAPVALVGLVTNREIVISESALNRVAKKFVEMRRTRAKSGELIGVVACLQVIISVAESQPQINGRGSAAAIEPADMDQTPGALVRR
ncbi:MAG TPA: hypothetical protein VGG60_17660, partial [Candidatus Binataceae bacterium]